MLFYEYFAPEYMLLFSMKLKNYLLYKNTLSVGSESAFGEVIIVGWVFLMGELA